MLVKNISKAVLLVSLLVLFFTNQANAQSNPKVTSIQATLTTGSTSGDGLDKDSQLEFMLHRRGETNWVTRAIKRFGGNDQNGGTQNEGDIKKFEIEITDNSITKDFLDKNYSAFMVRITAVGRDHYSGNLDVVFYFADGSTSGMSWDVSIGTYKEGNWQDYLVNFD
jgi:hypothetical protein